MAERGLDIDEREQERSFRVIVGDGKRRNRTKVHARPERPPHSKHGGETVTNERPSLDIG